LQRQRFLTRFVVGTMILAAIIVHLVEIGLFAAGIAVVAKYGVPDTPENRLELSHFDTLYYSATAYTSLGGAPPPSAELRLLTAVEALTGLILIAWTASFLFLAMQQRWEGDVK
jgi:hypothetical protein